MTSGREGGREAGKNADVKAMSVVNSNLWQARLEVVEHSRTEHRSYRFTSTFTFQITFCALSYIFVSIICILDILHCL